MNPARRFYTTAVATEEGGVRLDARVLRTPGGTVFQAPNRALADAVAGEWNAQGDLLVPATMPLTQLTFAALDMSSARRRELVDYVAGFIATDLLCHRAEAPAELAAHQGAVWDPLLAWASSAHALAPTVVAGVIAADADPQNPARIRAIAEALDDFRLTALAQAAGFAGSAIVALALLQGRIGPEEAFAAAALDDLWSQEKWGHDAEAAARLDRQRLAFQNLADFLRLLP